MNDEAMVREQLMFDFNSPVDEFSSAKSINVIINKDGWGRQIPRVTGKYKATDRIIRRAIINFGSITDFDIDTLPLSYVKCKGTEVTCVNNDSKRYGHMLMVNRRFLSELLSFWSYIVGIRYRHDSNPTDNCGIKLWSKHHEKIDVKQDLLTGSDGIYMLRDLLFLTRNKSRDDIFKNIPYSKVSPQLWSLLMENAISNKKQKFEKQLDGIKKRLFRVEQARNVAWSVPIINTNYIEECIKELDSGNFILDMGVPVIHDLWTYPLKCMGTLTCMRKVELEDMRFKIELIKTIWRKVILNQGCDIR